MKLTDKEQKILALLQSNRGKAVGTPQIYEQVWQECYLPSAQNTVAVHIRHLRQKLRGKEQIITCWGRGYLLEGVSDNENEKA